MIVNYLHGPALSPRLSVHEVQRDCALEVSGDISGRIDSNHRTAGKFPLQ